MKRMAKVSLQELNALSKTQKMERRKTLILAAKEEAMGVAVTAMREMRKTTVVKICLMMRTTWVRRK